METTVKIGGAAGQGIQTVGRLLSLACQRGGLYLMGIDDHESRVRGGTQLLPAPPQHGEG